MFILKGFVVQFREISVVYRKDSMLIADPSPDEKSGLFKLLSENRLYFLNFLFTQNILIRLKEKDLGLTRYRDQARIRSSLVDAHA